MQADNKAGNHDNHPCDDIRLCARAIEHKSFDFTDSFSRGLFFCLYFDFGKVSSGRKNLGINGFGIQKNQINIQAP